MTIVIAVVSVFVISSEARGLGSPALSFGFTDLDGSFVSASSGTGSFTALANLASTGYVTRILPSVQRSNFAFADISDGNTLASAQISMNLTSITADSAAGTGLLTLTDLDGDTVTASLAGSWAHSGAVTSFSGVMTHVMFNEQGDGSFEGSINGQPSGAFAMDFPAYTAEQYQGTIFELTLPSGWFTSDWAGVNTLVEGAVAVSTVPGPAAGVLGAVGLASVGWILRRERRQPAVRSRR